MFHVSRFTVSRDEMCKFIWYKNYILLIIYNLKDVLLISNG